MTLRDILAGTPKDLREALDYAPKRLDPDLTHTNALRPAEILNLKDEVVQSFINMGKNIAKALREAGQFAYDQGVKRQEEYEKAALAAEAKGEFQAREAGELISDFQTLRNVAINKNPVPMPPYATDEDVLEGMQK